MWLRERIRIIVVAERENQDYSVAERENQDYSVAERENQDYSGS